MKGTNRIQFRQCCLIVLILAVISLPAAFAQSQDKYSADSLGQNALFELSFGQNLLFISPARQNAILKSRDLVLPTSAILLFAQFRPEGKWKVPVFFNLPTESKQFIQPDGSLKNERASPSFGTGIEFRLFQLEVKEKTHLELEAGPLLSFITDFNSEFLLAPIIASRFRIRSGDNFVMYVGGSYTPGLNAFGLFFGSGTNF